MLYEKREFIVLALQISIFVEANDMDTTWKLFSPNSRCYKRHVGFWNSK